MALSLTSAFPTSGPAGAAACHSAPRLAQSAPLGTAHIARRQLSSHPSQPVVTPGASPAASFSANAPSASWLCHPSSQCLQLGGGRHRRRLISRVAANGPVNHHLGFGAGPSHTGRYLVTCGSSRMPPPTASGAASAGPPSRPGLPPQGGPAPASGPQFNPRYQPQRHQQPHLQPQHHHQHQHQPQSHHQVTSGRGAWTTPGPLAPGSSSSSSNSAGGVNYRLELAPLSGRPVGASGPTPQPTLAPAEESRLVAGAVSAPHAPAPSSPTSSASSSTSFSVSAAGRQPPQQPRQPPSSGPALSYNPQLLQPAEALSAQQFQPARAPQRSAAAAAVQEERVLPSGQQHITLRERTQLERLFIKDFALVSEQCVVLGPGVNVITGESGSGKSVLVEAFSQVLGAAAPQECIRAPAEMAVIEGTFVVGEEQRAAVWQLMSSCGLPQKALPGAGEAGSGGAPAAFRLTVRREISQAAAGGLRSRVYLNGAASSLRVLRELGSLLVDTNGQHSSMSLRDPATQLDLLDRIAGTSQLADSYCAALARLREVEGRLDELDELDDEDERARMQKLVDAVTKLRVQPGEERELRKTLKKMEARRSAVEQCGLVRMALCGEAGAGGVTDALRTIEAQLNAILAQEEQNRMAAAKAKGKDGSKAADGDTGGGGTAASGAAGEDEAGEEEDEEGEEGGAAAGARMMEEALEQVAAAKEMLAGAEGMVRSYARRYQFSQADHDATSERMARIERLMKQASAAGFGGAGGGGRGRGVARISSTEQLLEAAEGCSSKLAAYYEMEGQREEWEAQLESLVNEIRARALQLSSRRRAAAAALRSAVESCLRDLSMSGSRFDVRIGWAEERATGAAAEGLFVGEEEAEEAGVAELGGGTYVMGARGLDQVEFLLAAGPAEPLRPLAAVASGGESARVMLALKAAPAQAAAAAASTQVDPDAASSMQGSGVPIMILDELDSGIGARLGSAVGSILARMSLPTHGSNSQIICVTHLPQVACYAAHHIKVQKAQGAAAASSDGHSPSLAASSGGGADVDNDADDQLLLQQQQEARVTTTFVPLISFEERSEEVAAMLGLDKAVAEEMLRTAQCQVAGLYPPGAAPSGLLTAAPPAPSAGPSLQQKPANGPAGDGISSAPDDVLRVVHNALRSGAGGARAADGAPNKAAARGSDGGRTPFKVNLSPAMNPNAGLGRSSDAPSAVYDASSYYTNDDKGDDGEAEEAELSAQLMAGVEAAAMEHLFRMEAQAKAVAAAAAAAADFMSVAEVDAKPMSAGNRSVADERASSVLAAPARVQEQPASRAATWPAAAPYVAEQHVCEGGKGGAPGVAAAAGADAAVNGTSSKGENHGVAMWMVADPEDEAATADALLVAAAEALAAGRAEAEAGETEELRASVAEDDEAARGGDLSVWASAQVAAAVSQTTQSAAGTGFIVAVQPSRSPLPYDFGSRADDGPSAAAVVEEEAYGWDDGRAPASSGDVYDTKESPQQYEVSYDAYISASQQGGDPVHDGYQDDAVDAGGRFVVVPLGHEDEFREMFQSILSFTRQDYEGEAMRSCEETLWQALRDSGMA